MFQKNWNCLKDEQAAANKEFDYNKFLFDELEEVNFSENEIENIDAEIKLMSNAENIKTILSEIYFYWKKVNSLSCRKLKSISHNCKALKVFTRDIE